MGAAPVANAQDADSPLTEDTERWLVIIWLGDGAGGSVAQPLPPDPARACQLVRGLAEAIAPERRADALWVTSSSPWQDDDGNPWLPTGG
jgi:hypothetical protein